jgi:hypothetical protein
MVSLVLFSKQRRAGLFTPQRVLLTGSIRYRYDKKMRDLNIRILKVTSLE